MTSDQIRLVQESFRKVEPMAVEVATVFYRRLFETNPELQGMFRGPMDEQTRKLAHVLTMVVNSLDRLEQIMGAVRDLGRRHAGYGVTNDHYAIVGQTLLWTLEQGLGMGFTPEVSQAWGVAYVTLASAMQKAALEASIPRMSAA